MIARSLLSLALLAFGAAAEDEHYAYMCRDIRKPFFAAERGTYRSVRRQAWPSEFVMPRPPDTMRVFVVGESAASILYQPGGQDPLTRLLGASLPGRRVEHINCGMAAYESGRIRRVLKEVLGYDPSAVVVFSGNNNRETFYDLCPSAVNGVFGRLRDMVAGGMSSLARQERDLRRMVRLAKAKRVPIVLCTLPANLRDHAPWGMAPLAIPGFAEAWVLLEKGDASGAARGFREVLRTEPRNAFASFYLARALERLGDPRGAKERYEKALEEDEAGARCPRSRDAMIRRVAAEEGAALADLRGLFEQAAPHGLLDLAMMEDGVHWRSGYNALAACAVARALGAGCGSAPGPQPSRGEGKAPALQTLLYAVRYIQQWFAADPDGDVLELAVSYLESAHRMDPGLIARVSSSKGELARILKGNFWVRGLDTELDLYWPSYLCHLGEMLRRKGRTAEALRFLDAAADAAPERYMARFYRGRAYAAAGRAAEAAADFESLRPYADRRPEIAFFARRYGGGAWRKTDAR